MKKGGCIVSSIFLALLAAAPARARELQGVALPEETTVEGQRLALNGAGLRTATLLNVKVWVGRFYAPAPVRSEAEALSSEGPLLFDLVFLRSVGQERGAEAWRWQFAQSNQHDYPGLKQDVETLARAFGPISKGTVQSVALFKEEARVYENGSLKARIPGADFRRAFLSMFLGPKPPSQEVKKGFLGDGR